MAFSNTVVKTGRYGTGLVYEKGTFNGASVTTGTITCGTATSGDPSFNVRRIIHAKFTSNSKTSVKPSVSGVKANQIKITFGSSDTGTYLIVGEGC